MSLVTMENLRVTFHTFAGDVAVVRDVSLNLEAGEVLGIVGESGCGKSVTVQALMGLLPRDITTVKAEALQVADTDCKNFGEASWRHLRGSSVAMVFQDPMTALNPILSVGTQLIESIKLRAKRSGESLGDVKAEAAALLQKVGISDPDRRLVQYPHELSGGMRQRVVIALALAGKPRLLLADEPTTALDVTTEAQILLLLKELIKTEHMGLIIISHNLRVIAQMCDRMAVMYAGQIVEEGTVEALLGNPRHPYLQGLLQSLPTTATTKLQAIGGQPPDLYSLPMGCSFHPRCPKAMRICAREMPQLENNLRCWLAKAKITPCATVSGELMDKCDAYCNRLAAENDAKAQSVEGQPAPATERLGHTNKTNAEGTVKS
ncbi:MAG: ABC transporter ATP-binding protein [Veillonella sp.]|uniref:ABC transporter ATP-binding protein n=1 Tax=Veillonella sp. TaxID=1926307 RepID=UPI0025DC4292|nr:ABC transporter ATP-binding protein [Veillonella sp.]MBE6079355.1 ABC transporter ATP-binding protein [Veillonella sp.]